MIRSMEAGIPNARAVAVLAAAVLAGLAVMALQLAGDRRDPVALWVVFAPGVCLSSWPPGSTSGGTGPRAGSVYAVLFVLVLRRAAATPPSGPRSSRPR
jgi:hypothetical protein